MADPVYITTPIYYVNDKPHIGHAYTTLAADVLARYHRLRNRDVFFLTGTDEHGAKVAESAANVGMEPKTFADQNSKQFKKAFAALGIEYSRFLRTTDEDHERRVAAFMKKLHDAGAIYQGTYEGLYCTGCEEFKTEKELVDGKCPIHKTEPKHIQEKNYFFKLEDYLDRVQKLILDDTILIQPSARKYEAIGLIKQKLENFSISREKVTWGIPFPDDPQQTIYVWVEALQNYITAIGYGDDRATFESYWPNVTHLMAKDILKFHAIYWPALLLAAGEEPPKRLFIHGFFTINGQKMSKSLGNVIDPLSMVEKFGADGTRYLLLSQFPFGDDGDIQEERFVERFNGELANGLGNLFSRVLMMVEKFAGGEAPVASGKPDAALLHNVAAYDAALELDHIAIDKALSAIRQVVSAADLLIDNEKPWVLAKTDQPRLKEVLGDLLLRLKVLTYLVAPFLPTTSEQMQKALGLSTLDWEHMLDPIPSGRAIKRATPLFPRLG